MVILRNETRIRAGLLDTDPFDKFRTGSRGETDCRFWMLYFRLAAATFKAILPFEFGAPGKYQKLWRIPSRAEI
jgi:hypothetical protein